MKYPYVTPLFLRLSAVSALLLGACTNEVPDTVQNGAISFDIPQTRAVIESNNDMTAFNVWGWYDANTTPFAIFDNTKVEKSKNGWNYTDYARYWSPGKTYDFYGIHPSEISGVEIDPKKGTITVTNFDCSATGADAVDLMTASRKGMDGSNPEMVTLTFNHELAKVNFTVKSEKTVATVSSFKVYGVNYKGTLIKGQTNTTWNQVAACVENDNLYKLENFTFNTTNGFEKDMLGDVLLIPDTDLTDAKLYIAYRYPEETTDRTSTINLKTTAITQWEAGKSYHYTLTIKGGKLTITVNVADWDEEDTSVSWG